VGAAVEVLLVHLGLHVVQIDQGLVQLDLRHIPISLLAQVLLQLLLRAMRRSTSVGEGLWSGVLLSFCLKLGLVQECLDEVHVVFVAEHPLVVGVRVVLVLEALALQNVLVLELS